MTNICGLGREASGYSRWTRDHHCVQMEAEAKVKMYGGELVRSLYFVLASYSLKSLIL